MLRTAVLVAAALGAVSFSVDARSSQDAAVAVLNATRQALGGDAALNGVTSIDVKGTLTRTLASRSFEQSVEYAAVLPDRFVEVTESTSDLGPLGSAFHQRRSGFAGDDPIDQDETDSPIPPPTIATKAPTSAQEIADKQATALTSRKHAFARFVLPLLATSPAAHPLTFSMVGRIAGPNGPADAIDASGPDGFVRHLFVDAQTHLIVGIVWMAKPVVAVSVTSGAIVSSSRGGSSVSSVSPPPILPANPTENLADVQWQLTIADYRAANRLTWPHRLSTTFGGRKYEDVKLGTYRVNSKIDPGMFRRSSR